MAPLLYHDRPVGLVEIVDQKRSRHYSRQELRLCRAIAGQAAAALHNAKLFADQARSDHDISRMRAALQSLTQSVPAMAAADSQSRLAELARAACAALEAVSCVASFAGDSAGAFGDGAAGFETGDDRGTRASLVVAREPSGAGDFTLAVTLAEPPTAGQIELLDLIAAAGGALLHR
jgi:hypothetical protein